MKSWAAIQPPKKPENAMKTFCLTTDFITPPENQGQIVTVSYALAADEEAIIERTHYASDRTTRYDAYSYPENDDGDWAPWNGAPELGDHLGECSISVDE